MVIPCRMPPWIFQGDGDIIISVISIIIMFSLVLYHCTPPIFLRDHNVNKVTELLCIIPAISPYGNVFYQIHIFNRFKFAFNLLKSALNKEINKSTDHRPTKHRPHTHSLISVYQYLYILIYIVISVYYEM